MPASTAAQTASTRQFAAGNPAGNTGVLHQLPLGTPALLPEEVISPIVGYLNTSLAASELFAVGSDECLMFMMLIPNSRGNMGTMCPKEFADIHVL